jgi:outer membrane protein
MKEKLEAKQDSIDKALNIKAKILEQDVVRYQERAPSMSAEQRAQEEEKLMGRQQNLMQLKQTMLEQLQEEEAVMNDSIHDNLTRFLKEYNKEKKYLYILGYQRGSGILLANDSLDITREVLDGLNK